MVTRQKTSAGFSPDGRSLVIGAVLIGAGSAIGLAGLAVCSASVVSATRRWIGDMEVPPRQLARQKWNLAKTAAAAGADAWQKGSAEYAASLPAAS
jgi:hypothetical protein